MNILANMYLSELKEIKYVYILCRNLFNMSTIVDISSCRLYLFILLKPQRKNDDYDVTSN